MRRRFAVMRRTALYLRLFLRLAAQEFSPRLFASEMPPLSTIFAEIAEFELMASSSPSHTGNENLPASIFI